MKALLSCAACLLLAFSAVPIWSQRSAYDPAAGKADKQRDSFVDFALKQINPQNTDYGCQVQAARRLAIDETVKNIDFWIVLVSFSFLVLSFFTLFHQQKEAQRREIIAAEFLAQYHNAWVDARSQAEVAIRHSNQLAHTLNSAAEGELRPQSPHPEQAQVEAAKPYQNCMVKPRSAGTGATANPGSAGVHEGNRSDCKPGVPFPARASEADLMAQIGTLQQQLNASYQREKHLQKEFNQGQRRVLPAPVKNPGLPG